MKGSPKPTSRKSSTPSALAGRWPTVTEASLLQRVRASTFARNLLSLGGAAILNRALGLATLGWAARHLGPEGYGRVGFGLSITAYASILLSPGLTTWGVRAIAQDRAAAGRLLVIVNGTQVLLSLIGFAGAVIFALTSLTETQEQVIVMLSALMLFTQALSADWVLNGLELARITAGFGVLISLFSTVGLLLWVRGPQDLYHVPLLAFSAAALTLVGAYWVLLRHLHVRLELPTRQQTWTALRASMPLGVVAALVVVLHYANNLIVRGFLGERELGVYLSGYRLVELASTVPTILAGAFFPRLARTVVGAPDQAAREARLFARVHIVPGMLFAAIMVLEPDTIVNVIYGAKYADAVPLVRVMAPALLFNYAICGYTNCLISYGRDRVMLLVVIVSSIVSVGGGLLLVPRLGAFGAAIAISLVDLSGWLVSLPAYRKAIGSLQLNVWRWPLAGALFVALASLGLRALEVPWPVRIPLACAGYLPFVYLSFRDVLKPVNHPI
jgi:PST family polysaccharide transporter